MHNYAIIKAVDPATQVGFFHKNKIGENNGT